MLQRLFTSELTTQRRACAGDWVLATESYWVEMQRAAILCDELADRRVATRFRAWRALTARRCWARAQLAAALAARNRRALLSAVRSAI